jgi:hypothetical protein
MRLAQRHGAYFRGGRFRVKGPHPENMEARTLRRRREVSRFVESNVQSRQMRPLILGEEKGGEQMWTNPSCMGGELSGLMLVNFVRYI